jgi:two-component system response regulator PilR (NtrC family)
MKAKTKILVIDDELSILNALNIILEDVGHIVVTAATGHEGIKQFQLERFDITITDLCLPDMTGLDVINQICELQPGSHVILITSYATPETFVEMGKCATARFLLKPFEPFEIIDLVENEHD